MEMIKLMKKLATGVIGAGVLIGSFSVAANNQYKSSEYEACGENASTEICKAYVSGMVDGYIASKQKFTTTQPAPDSKFLKRVYSSRVTDDMLNSDKPEPACLPAMVDRQVLIDSLLKEGSAAKTAGNQSMSTQLYQKLQALYGC